MSWRNPKEMNIPQGVDIVNPNYTHPQLVMTPDLHVLPIDLLIGFTWVLMGKCHLFSGKPSTQLHLSEEDETALFIRPYNEWAPPPFNNCSIRVDSAMNRATAAVSGMGDLLSIVNTTSTECDRDLHHMKTRLLHGLPPMSLSRWRKKGLHGPENMKRACQYLCAVVDAFEYLNLPHSESRMRKACNGVWTACHDFSRALNAYRQEKGRSPISVTAAWEEYMVDYFETVAARAHAWVMERIDELREMLILQLRNTTGDPNDQVSSTQMAILDSIHDLVEITNKADTKIMLPLFGFTLKTLTSAAPRLRDDWNGYGGAEPMTQYSYDMRVRSRVYGIRCRYLSRTASVQQAFEDARNGVRRSHSDPQSLERTCRLQVREYLQARRELRGPEPEMADEPWIVNLKNTMRLAVRPPLRVWGFIGYRISYEHSDEECKQFLESFKDNVTGWGEGLKGAADVKPACKLRWIDGREHGISEGDIEAARRHYEEYSKSPACEGFLTPAAIFLAADKAAIDSYLKPVPDTAEPIIPRGDLGSFVLAAKASDKRGTDNRRRDQRRRDAETPSEEFDGTLRVLGSILFDDFWALMGRSTFGLKELAKLAAIHPQQVYTGPSVPVERQGWRHSGCWSLTVLKSFEKWQSL
ncbi:uncharacterized protein ColSpa_08343 [Colletotrichum spaethianum]|uniref:Uncharacterized protein n=1 Tax=Colletotrichum spaethianum TaxID=700344 RepID=A0AA37P9K5_9PEZI|nr:uncharacterized protein ColSpa_08343 [Colletotrichum spaethianum]GKT48162.1 hypothetical protein ColSpa_08343 [Colletotrichum spaethianum]